MRNARKTEQILNLEKEDVSPDKYEFMTVQEAEPVISKIARAEGKNLTNPEDFKYCVDKMKRDGL